MAVGRQQHERALGWLWVPLWLWFTSSALPPEPKAPSKPEAQFLPTRDCPLGHPHASASSTSTPLMHLFGGVLEHSFSAVPSTHVGTHFSPTCFIPEGQPHLLAASTMLPLAHIFHFFAEHIPSFTVSPSYVQGIGSQNIPFAETLLPCGQPHFVALSA
jgi:hypothetical protein